MKIKSYHILFRIFSYLADKTNGTPLFVKYKLLLGTLILSVTASSANAASKIKMANDTIHISGKPEQIEEVTCYKPVIYVETPQDSTEKIEVKGKVQDESGEPLPGVTVTFKNNQSIGTYTDTVGIFRLEATLKDTLGFSYIGMKPQEIPVSEIIKMNRPIVMEESSAILCYEVVVSTARSYADDIYYKAPKKPKNK